MSDVKKAILIRGFLDRYADEIKSDGTLEPYFVFEESDGRRYLTMIVEGELEDEENDEDKDRVYAVKVYIPVEVFRFFLLGVAAHILACAVDESFENADRAWLMLENASQIFHPINIQQFNQLYHAVAMYFAIMKTKDDKHFLSDVTTYERELYEKFKEKVKDLLGDDVEVIEKENDRRHIPDLWVRIGGEDVPVEIKKGPFDWKALSQLIRYMLFYKSKFGIAVGSELKADLPDNITFIPTTSLE